tara:strand:+ start:67 stop:177 length:111 start_codon:yes stop_codon:yes gene_type:complete
MIAMIVIKTAREVAYFSHLEVAWDIRRVDISVGEAA